MGTEMPGPVKLGRGQLVCDAQVRAGGGDEPGCITSGSRHRGSRTVGGRSWHRSSELKVTWGYREPKAARVDSGKVHP